MSERSIAFGCEHGRWAFDTERSLSPSACPMCCHDWLEAELAYLESIGKVYRITTTFTMPKGRDDK